MSWCLLCRDLKYLDVIETVKNIFFTSKKYNYLFTPCRNGIICPIDTIYSCMVTQSIQSVPFNGCINIAWWNEDVKPLYDIKNEIWKFKYENAECIGYYPNNTTFHVYFQCDSNAGNYKLISVQKISQCVIEMRINTSLGCNHSK